MATFEGGQKQGSELTTAEINKLKYEVLQIYREAQKAIEKELAVWYSKFLTEANPDDYYNIMLQGNRLTQMLQNINMLYTKASLAAGITTKEASKLAMTNQFYRQEYLMFWFAPEVGGQLSFSFINPVLLDTSVFGTDKVWNTISKKAKAKIEAVYGSINAYNPKAGSLTQLLADNRKKQLADLRRLLIRDLLTGKSYGATVKDVNKLIGTEKIKNGKKIIAGAKGQAMMIIRTEGNRNLNAGSYAYSQLAHNKYNINMKRKLLATLDTRTRRQSASMDGQTVDIDKSFHYPDGSTAFYPGNSGNPAYDVNDRETVIDLLIDNEGNVTDPKLRRGRNPVTGINEVFTYRDFDTWAKDNSLKWSKSGKLVIS